LFIAQVRRELSTLERGPERARALDDRLQNTGDEQTNGAFISIMAPFVCSLPLFGRRQFIESPFQRTSQPSSAFRHAGECYAGESYRLVTQYPGHVEVRRVSNAGTFRLHTKQQFLSQALNGLYIGLEQVSDGIWNILSTRFSADSTSPRNAFLALLPSEKSVSYVPGRFVSYVPGCSADVAHVRVFNLLAP